MEGGPLAVIALLLLAPLLIVQERRRAWRLLSPVEQNLRRASHGFALVVSTVAAVLFVYGATGVRDFFPWAVAHPEQAWPGALFFGGLIAVGMARFLAGASRVAGVRDRLLQARAFVKLAVGLAVTVYLGRLYPWPGVSDWAAILALLAALGIGAWLVVIGGVRFLVLSLGGGNALRRIKRYIKRRNAPLRPARRPWWRLWW
jgi:hypothetical protein